MPELKQYQIVKGIGRCTPSPEIRRFLIQWLDDRNLDDLTRLAAASALTRDPDPDAGKALESTRSSLFLNRAIGATKADTLIAAAALRRSFNAALEDSTPRPYEFSHWFTAPFGKTFLIEHLMVLERLPSIYPWQDDPKTAAGIGQVLVSNSARLSEVVDDWNTYSWMPCRFRHDLEFRKKELETLSHDQQRMLRERCDEAMQLHKERIRPVLSEREVP